MTAVTQPRLRRPRPRTGPRVARTAVVVVITAVVLIPIIPIVTLGFTPRAGSSAPPITLETFGYVLTRTSALRWLQNSLVVTAVSTVLSVAVSAPAGYVMARARGRGIAGFSLALFVLQSLPIIVFVIPLFQLFARLGLVDSLTGLAIVHVAASLAVCSWMIRSHVTGIPESLEEAAWIDGASRFGGFVRVVLPNLWPAIISTAIFSFLLSWNDYLTSIVFLRNNDRYVLPIGLQTFFQQFGSDWPGVMAVAVIMLLPPVLVFTFLNRFFHIGGIAGSLAGD